MLNLGTQENDTWLFLQRGAVLDMSDVPYNIPESVRASVVYPDTTQPELVMFSLDINEGILNLTFSETVDATSLKVDQITLLAHPEANESDYVHSLSPPPYGGSGTNSINSTLISITLGDGDLNEIKRLFRLATSVNTTFLSITEDTIVDMSGLKVAPYNETSPLRAFEVKADTTDPVLVGFSLDMNEGVLSLTFSETVNSDSFNVLFVTLLDSPAVSYTHLTLPTIYSV